MTARVNRGGNVYGKWKAVRARSINGRLWWVCQCIACGITEKLFAGYALERGNCKRSCGCDDIDAVEIRIDRTGHTYGWLKVIDRAPDRGPTAMWNCVCTYKGCGKKLVVAGGALQQGQVACGCYGAEARVARGVSARKPEGVKANRYTFNSAHAAWLRCYKPTRDGYERYGGRGITFDPRWLRSDGKLHFAAFLASMGTRPEGSELHRMDADGPYSPENCFWSGTRPHAETLASVVEQGELTNQRLRAQLRLLGVEVVTDRQSSETK